MTTYLARVAHLTLSQPEQEIPAGPPRVTERAEHRDPSGWGLLPVLAPVVAVGLLLVSVSYAGGRSGAAWGDTAYWAGQLTIFVPVVWRLLAIRGSGSRQEREIVGLVLVVAAAYFAAKFLYAPLDLAFNDEFQHWRTAEDMLVTGRLFDYNYALPISPYYPGMESITVAVVQLTGLSIFHAGVLVVGAARIVFTAALYLLVRRVAGSARAAGIASILFTTAYYYKSILAMFIYTNLALPLLVLVLSTAVHLTTTRRLPGERRTWIVLGVVVAVVVVTHHFTSYVLILALALGGALHLYLGHVEAGRKLLALAGAGAALVTAWLVFVAPSTIGYLAPAITSLLDGIREAGSGQTPTEGGLLQTPIVDRVMSYASVLAVMLALPLAWRRIWRTQRGRPWALALLVTSAGFYAVPVIRLVSASGTEHASRLMNYLLIPVAYVLAVAALRLLDGSRRRTVAAVAVATVIMVGGITSGWPQYWERLPAGQTIVSGSESGVGPQGLAAGYWAQEMLPAGQRIAADENNVTLMGPLGQQEMLHGMGPLYYDTNVDDVKSFIRQNAVQYVVVDLRMAQQLPADGEYFPDDPLASRHDRPIALDSLTKFDRLPGARRVFDGGDIRIYDVREVPGAP